MRLDGGLIDRGDRRAFTFDGRAYEGFAGDTLASALLANDVRLMGRSFKYHRPRGPMTAGSEEPNALAEIGTGARREPNTRATTQELYDGLTARSQNRWPSLRFDAMAVNDALSPFLAAGFYYKTFMWPRAFWEKLYEPLIRRAAGLGSLSGEPDPDIYDHGYLHCDLLVVGSGPAGLAAALTAGRAGARVILAEEDFRLGGRLLAERHGLGEWLDATLAELETLDNVRVMPRTTIIGTFDHGICGAVERVADHVPAPAVDGPRQVLWRIYAKHCIVAAGATERGIAFENNDRPGIMMAGAVRAFVNRWAALPGRRAVVFTNNDDGLRTANDLRAHEIEVETIDTRVGETVIDASGRLGLKSIEVDGPRGRRTVPCDVLAVSGGWNPNVHMTCHQRGRPEWREEIASFVPGGTLPPNLAVAGAAAGEMSTHGALTTGRDRAMQALAIDGIDLPQAEDAPYAITPFWHVEGAERAWLDQQNDVTVKDVRLAHQEGFRAVEHLKRYTTLGMATDQGKTSNLGGLAVMAEMSGQPIERAGTTMFRPPYSPIAIGTLAGRSIGEHFKPTRLTPSHAWAQERGGRLRRDGPVDARAMVPAAGRNALARERRSRGAGRERARRYLRRHHPRQDRRAGYGRGGVSEPRLRQRLRKACAQPRALRRDATRGRDRDGRRHLRPVRTRPLRRHHHDGERRAGLSAHGIRPPVPLPGPRRAAHLDHGSVGAVRGRRSPLTRPADQDRRRAVRHLERSIPLHGLRRTHRLRRHPRADLPHLVLGRARLRDRRTDPTRRRASPRVDGSRRGVRRGALRYGSAGRAAHREGSRCRQRVERHDDGRASWSGAHGVEGEGTRSVPYWPSAKD